MYTDVSISVNQLKGSWDEVKEVPCDLRVELGIEGCEKAPFVGVEPSPHRPGRR